MLFTLTPIWLKAVWWSAFLGNDLAGGTVLLNPEVTLVPLTEHPDELSQRYPEVFSVCAVTRAMAGKHDSPETGREVHLADSFMIDPGCL